MQRDPDLVYPIFFFFSCLDLKQIFIVSALQATGSEISHSCQVSEELMQTGCPSLAVTGFDPLLEDRPPSVGAFGNIV